VTFKRKILEDKFHFIFILIQHLLEERLKPRAVRSLVVAEDGDGNRGVLGALIWQPPRGKLIHDFEADNLHLIIGTTRSNEGICFFYVSQPIEAASTGMRLTIFPSAKA